jgi:hypothetical protein
VAARARPGESLRWIVAASLFIALALVALCAGSLVALCAG